MVCFECTFLQTFRQGENLDVYCGITHDAIAPGDPACGLFKPSLALTCKSSTGRMSIPNLEWHGDCQFISQDKQNIADIKIKDCQVPFVELNNHTDKVSGLGFRKGRAATQGPGKPDTLSFLMP